MSKSKILKNIILVTSKPSLLSDPLLGRLLHLLQKTNQLHLWGDFEVGNMAGCTQELGLDIKSLHLDTNRPFELQLPDNKIPENPIYLLLDSDDVIGTVSTRIPCIWLQTKPVTSATSKTFLSIQNASLVIGPPAVQFTHSILKPFYELGSEFEDNLVKFIEKLDLKKPSNIFHKILSAEMFRRDHLTSLHIEALDKDLPNYIRRMVDLRVKGPKTENSTSLELQEEESDFTKAILWLIKGSNNTPDFNPKNIKQGLVGSLASISTAETLEDASDRFKSVCSDSSPSTQELARRVFINKALTFEEIDIFEPDPKVEISPTDIGKCINLSQAISLLGQELPISYFESLRQSQNKFISIVGLLGIVERRDKPPSQQELQQIDTGINLIDSFSWHPGLWKTGLKYWHDATGRHWIPGPLSAVIPKPESPYIVEDSDHFPHLNTAANALLAAGLYQLSADTHQVLRVSAIALGSGYKSTELAARLNIGWIMWKEGRPERYWEDHLSTSLSAVQPPSDFISLRANSASCCFCFRRLFRDDRGHWPGPSCARVPPYWRTRTVTAGCPVGR